MAVALSPWTKLRILIRGIIADELMLLALRVIDARDGAYPSLVLCLRDYMKARSAALDRERSESA